VFYITAFLLGSIWGSFSNVCIKRLPYKLSISGRSYCLNCKENIKWYDNIPIISYIVLKAKCRNCSTKIDNEYFLVELISAISFLLIFHFYGVSLICLLFFILTIFFIIIFFIDLKHFIIPNELSYPLMLIGFGKTFLINSNILLFPNFKQSLIGGVLGFFIIWLIIFLYKKLKNIEGMGLGDAKLLSALGFWFGWVALPFILIFSSLIALIYSLPSLIKKTKSMTTQIPFGPYLIIGCVIYIVLVDQIFFYVLR